MSSYLSPKFKYITFHTFSFAKLTFVRLKRAEIFKCAIYNENATQTKIIDQVKTKINNE